MKQVYFDNAATTQIRSEVIEAMTNSLKNNYGNASSSHSFGRSSKSLIEGIRKDIASYFNVSAGEIVFTSGGTEADNLVLRSAVRDLGVTEIITSKIEHHAILHTIDELVKEYGIAIKYVNIDSKGMIDYNHLETLLQSDKKQLVTLMHINNEIGNKLDISRVANLCKANSALFHSDTVQSVGHYDLDLQEIPIDFLAASAHKFHGPKGAGFCFIRKGSGLKPLIFGGEQERGYRAGTESVHNIVGLGESLKLAYENLEKESTYVKGLKEYFISRISKELPEVAFNGCSGDMENSTYTLVNMRLPVSEEKSAMLLFQLDLKGIACSKGSACQSGATSNSHVLSQILTEDELKKPSVRFSFSIYNTKEEIDYAVEVLKELINS
ncbi:cysteine desulfurase [Flavobacteriaceae bacterium S0825]|uniref:cysteine desulfurase family protein n=1 Tax=Gaetbulibacter sp. S0825 TaxID=2720084 RepID=UPI001430654A|nr:cysteine desulfurase family protein [Gaetbulibacter sp. S0825]MCK0109884.1 cysteine desulfurase [Flavobacteriaceae bacterium S0825]NIX65513.1 cysteine desulfurase [Gaetbulibacter sp. S0825]